MPSRSISQYTALTSPTGATVVPVVDLTEGLASNRNKKATLSDLTKGLSAASTTAAGVVQLTDSTASTSITTAATPNAVKSAYDLANGRGRITLGTPQNSTSGTSIDFTGLPSWVDRVTVSFAGISTNGTSPIIVQLGTASSIETSNYLGTSGYIQNSAQSLTSNLSSGVILVRDNAAANVTHGSIIFTLVSASSNTWAAFGVISNSNNSVPSMVAGSKALAGTLTRVRITTVGGTDTFDAGVVNILYEG